MTDAAARAKKKLKIKIFLSSRKKEFFRFGTKLSGLVKKKTNTNTHRRQRLYKKRERDPAVSEANERDDLIDRDKPLSLSLMFSHFSSSTCFVFSFGFVLFCFS